jgi:hypothetical protein
LKSEKSGGLFAGLGLETVDKMARETLELQQHLGPEKRVTRLPQNEVQTKI